MKNDTLNRTPLHHAVIDGNVERVNALINSKSDVNCVDKEGWTPLHFAASSQNVAIGKLLINSGAKIDQTDRNGNTPLFRAVFESRGNGEFIQLLLHFGADRNIKNKSGTSPLILAKRIENYNIVQYFE